MPVESQLVGGSVVLRLVGSWEVADIAEEIDRRVADPAFVQGARLLIDARHSRAEPLPPEALRKIARAHARFLLRRFSAVGFLSRDAFQWGVAREFQRAARCSAFDHSFADYVSAVAWLTQSERG